MANHWWISSSKCSYDVHLSGAACWSVKAICSLVRCAAGSLRRLLCDGVLLWPGPRVTAQVRRNKKVPKWQLDKSEMTFRLCFAESKVKGAGWPGAEGMNKRVMGGAEICQPTSVMSARWCLCLSGSGLHRRCTCRRDAEVSGFVKPEWFGRAALKCSCFTLLRIKGWHKIDHLKH